MMSEEGVCVCVMSEEGVCVCVLPGTLCSVMSEEVCVMSEEGVWCDIRG